MNQDTFPGTSIAAVYAHSEQKKYSSLTLFYPFALVKIQNNFEKHKQRGGKYSIPMFSTIRGKHCPSVHLFPSKSQRNKG